MTFIPTLLENGARTGPLRPTRRDRRSGNASDALPGGVDRRPGELRRSLAQAYAPAKVRVNAVAPGWIATPLSEGLRRDEEASRRIMDRTPGEPADVADAIVFPARGRRLPDGLTLNARAGTAN